MANLLIWRAKPNPAGKDKVGEKPKPEQLNGEWAEIKNTSATNQSLGGVKLSHTLFDTHGKPEKTEVYWVGKGTISLKPGEVVRVHTGRSADKGLMKVEDSAGADYHDFAENGQFKLNNKEGDKLYVEYTDGSDNAYYDPHVKEGVVLIRVGDKLIDRDSGGGGSTAAEWPAPAVIGTSGKAA